MPEDPSRASLLVRRWESLRHDLRNRAGTEVPPERWRALRDDLLGRYAEPHRHHHDQRHLLEVLEALDDLAGPDPAPVTSRLAAWFHDAVYQGVAGDDEVASAQLARAELDALGLDPSLVEEVAEIVAATAGHLVPDDPADDGAPGLGSPAALLLDADLSILAAEAGRYDVYAAGIRAEHPELDDAGFRDGRLAALRTLAGREHLFHTQAGRERLEPTARRNLDREIGRLSGPGGG